MDRRERNGEPVTAFLAMLQGWQSNIWTALPGILITPLDPVKRTVQVQILTQVLVQKPDETFEWVSIPPLLDCPVMFPSGGGCTLTFPLKVGDECLVILASRCIDAWWQSGPHDPEGRVNPQVQPEFRMHSLSDGFAFVGVSSVPQVIPAISTTTAQFRNDEGNTFVEIDPGGEFINIITPGNVNITTGGNTTINATGNANINAQGPVNVTSAAAVNIAAPSVNVN